MRAIRYALEAGPVEVLAIDKSGEACEGALAVLALSACGFARLSVIESVAWLLRYIWVIIALGGFGCVSSSAFACSAQRFQFLLTRHLARPRFSSPSLLCWTRSHTP